MPKPSANNYQIQEIFHFLIILAISKLLKSCGIYICYDLIKSVYIVPLLFLLAVFNSLFFMAIQRLFNKTGGAKSSKSSPARHALNKFQWLRMAKYSLVLIVIKLFWLYGLVLCGPLRTILIFEHSEFIVINLVKSVFLSQTNPSRSRGALLLLIGFVVLLAFDHDDLREKLNEQHHPEGRNHGFLSHIILAWFNMSDHKSGVLLLALSLVLEIVFNNATKPLVNEVGGPIRLKTLSAYVSCGLLAPFFVFYLFGQGLFVKTFHLDADSTLYLAVCIGATALFVYTIDAYVDLHIANKTNVQIMSKYGTWFMFVFAIVLSSLWTTSNPYTVVIRDKIKTIVTQEHVVSNGVLCAFILFMFATQLLSNSIREPQGNLIGYSSGGYPIYSLTGETIKRKSLSVLTFTRSMFKEIIAHSDSRNIFYFLCINLSFTFVELVYGVWTNSLGLISDGFHMLFDCSALVMGLFAAVISQWKPTRVFSYGFGRIEVLSGFINGLFLIVIAIFVFIEGVGRLFEPPEIKTDRLMFVSAGGLLVIK
jgi:zinc transporter 5/7